MRSQRLAALLVVALVVVACSNGTVPANTTNPTVPRTTTPIQYLGYSDRIDMVVECVRAHGYEAENYEGFGIMVDPGDESNLETAEAIQGACWDEIDARYPPPPPLDGEELYDYMLEIAECLQGEGMSVEEPPTLDAYLDQLAAMKGNWSPWTLIPGEYFWDLQHLCGPDPWFR